jgi:hypothetical protein
MEDVSENPTERWERKDVWLGLLFLLAGGLIVLHAVLVMRNRAPVTLWGLGLLVGPFLLLLGGNAVIRSLLAGDRDR